MGNLNILQPHTALAFILSSAESDHNEQLRSTCDKENLKSLVCDLLLAFIIFFLSVPFAFMSL